MGSPARGRFAGGAFGCWACACCSLLAAASDGPPPRSLAAADEAWAATVGRLAARAAGAGDAALAETLAGWPLPAAGDRQLAVRIPPRLERPASVDTATGQSIWDDFVAARRARAAELLAHATRAAGDHDRPTSRERSADHDAPPPGQRSCEALRLLHEALREDPENPRARGIGGYVRRGGDWVRPAAARRLDRGEVRDPAAGWVPRGKLARADAASRDEGPRSPADDAGAGPRDVRRGREFHADHWDIVTVAGLPEAAALAERLEETRDVWLQVFGGYAVEPADLERRFAGRPPPPPRPPHAAILCAGRAQYVAELERVEPLAGRTRGIYWTPTKTAWFFVDAAADPPAPDEVTVRHEATHQLFTEGRTDAERTRHLAGERCGFWAIEAAACHMESLRPTAFGWTVGGLDAGRVPAARRLRAGGFSVPLSELCGMGRAAFQAHDRLADLYDQVAGQADFFMNGEGGRYREPFVEYLSRVYRGTADADTLPRLCRRSFDDLDEACRRHVARE